MAAKPTLCPSCGQPIPSGRLDGFCPACLWRGLFVDGLANQPEGEAATFGSLQLPGLTVVGEIARGGMGIVYRAHQAAPERDVALKMLLPHQVASPAAKERFRAEARAIAALDHPGILPVHQVGELDGLPWFTMKLAAGGSLAQRKEKFAGQWRAIAGLMVKLAEAIQFAHERGILHRDLKPGNILFDESGQVYVSDFGLAKFLDADTSLTESRAMLGTPSYLAPELLDQTAAGATTAADIYGLGALLYELLYGRPPFEAPSLAALLKQISESSPSFASASGQRLPRDLEVICRKCLEKDPARRYSSARELSTDLRRWLEGRPILARPAPLAEVLTAWMRRNPVVASLAGLLALALIGGGIALSVKNRSLAIALVRSETAERAERASLRAALLAQAKARSQTTQAGHRAAVLETLQRVAAIPAPADATNALAELREEVIAALTSFDLELERGWPLPLAPTDTNGFATFAPKLDCFAFAHGGVTDIVSCSNQTVLAQFPVAVLHPPNNLTFSHNGKLLAMLHADGNASVWEIAGTNQLLAFNAAEGGMLALDFHPRDEAVVVVRRGAPVELRDFTGRLLNSWPVTNALAARFSPAAGRIAIVTSEGVEVRNADSRELLWAAPVKTPVQRVAWHPGGTSLLAASRMQHVIFVLDVFTGAVQALHNGQMLDLARFEFHPTGHLVASAGRRDTLCLWDPRTGRDLAVLKATSQALGFSPDGSQLGFSPAHRELGLLTVETSRSFRAFEQLARSENVPEDLLLTPDGRELITVNFGAVHRWDTTTAAPIEQIVLEGEGRTPWAELSPDGEFLLYGQGGEINLQRGRTNDPTTAKTLPISISAPGRLLDVNAAGDWLVEQADFTLALWPRGVEGKARVIGNRHGGVRHALSPDGRWIAISHQTRQANRMVRIVETESGKVVARLTVVTNLANLAVSRAWFTPDSKRLLTSNGLRFALRETGSWKLLRRWLTTDLEVPGCAAITPDGKLAALEISPDVFHLVELATGAVLATLRPPTPLAANAVVFSPDGKQLYISGNGPSIFQWDLDSLRRELSALRLGW